MNANVSTLFNVDVSVGGVFPDHLVPVGHVTVLAVPSATNCNVKEYTLGEDGTFVNVNVVID
jgi:hypothetical protein